MIIHFKTLILKGTLCSQTFHLLKISAFLSKSMSSTRITILESFVHFHVLGFCKTENGSSITTDFLSKTKVFFFWFIYRSDRNIFLAELRNLSKSQFQTPLLYKLFFQLARCVCSCNVWIVATCDFLYNCSHQMDKYLKPSFT